MALTQRELHYIRTLYMGIENMLSTGNEVRRTSPANHPPIWSKWSEWSMPPGVTRSECIPSLRCLLFCHAGPEKSSTLIYRCRLTMQTLLECFVRINLYFLHPNRCVQWNCIYSLWVRLAHEQYWSFTKLCLCVFLGRISYEFGNFKLSVYRNGTKVHSWK